jgi:hypothetical protein
MKATARETILITLWVRSLFQLALRPHMELLSDLYECIGECIPDIGDLATGSGE